jgi:hypothetical protein
MDFPFYIFHRQYYLKHYRSQLLLLIEFDEVRRPLGAQHKPYYI